MQLWLNKQEVETLRDSRWVVICTTPVRPEGRIADLSSDVKMLFVLFSRELRMY